MTKEKFDKIYALKNTVVHCDTKVKANELLKLAREYGYRWCNGIDYLNLNNWEMKKSDTCYNINQGSYADIEFYKNKNFTIIEYPAHVIRYSNYGTIGGFSDIRMEHLVEDEEKQTDDPLNKKKWVCISKNMLGKINQYNFSEAHSSNDITNANLTSIVMANITKREILKVAKDKIHKDKNED